jgi:hypothetical protein
MYRTEHKYIHFLTIYSQIYIGLLLSYDPKILTYVVTMFYTNDQSVTNSAILFHYVGKLISVTGTSCDEAHEFLYLLLGTLHAFT